MNKTTRNTVRLRLAALFIAAVGFASPAVALEYATDEVCEFPISFDVGQANGGSIRGFVDRDGNLVKVLIAGSLGSLTVTNLWDGNAITFPSKGQQQRYKFNDDGTQTYTTSGVTVIVWFEADDPGPAAIAYTGHTVVHIDANNVWTLLKSTGKQIDLCELLE